MRANRKKIKFIIFVAILFFVLLGSAFFVWQKGRTFEFVSGQNNKQEQEINEDQGPKSPISGLACENANRRPLAIMLSSDAEARPLAGISQADLVFEMPVVEGGITRLMAVFVCNSPEKIGSVRSARHDFIPLALGLDAIYAHWGGSHFALEKLKTGIMDNIDALPNPYNAFYRQSGIAAPHNGFTSAKRLLDTAGKLGYQLTSELVGYQHLLKSEIASQEKEKKILKIKYPGAFGVSYQYDPETNSYFRFRNNLKEIDKNNNSQVEAKNIVIMRAQSRQLEDQYNDVQIEGNGDAEFYLNGQVIKGRWEKDSKSQKSKLFFYDEQDQEIKFVPGQIWVQIADPTQEVAYGN
ncbi:MAG: DUF3048 domain-containing protein [Candidatus Portnoybacteria bacterium]|nr:DUF3048 domain-containing protein [Candidatus Portnoybacteria bacterium]